jgi:hypothetical protein
MMNEVDLNNTLALIEEKCGFGVARDIEMLLRPSAEPQATREPKCDPLYGGVGARVGYAKEIVALCDHWIATHDDLRKELEEAKGHIQELHNFMVLRGYYNEPPLPMIRQWMLARKKPRL